MPKVTGNLRGLGVSEKKDLERLYRRKVDTTAVLSPELGREMASISRRIGRQVGVLLDRRGRVTNVIVGTRERIVIPDPGRLREENSRFRGLRLIHTHLLEKSLDEEDLADLTLMRLDMICAVTSLPDGLPGKVWVAHIVPGFREGAGTGSLSEDGNMWRVMEFPYPAKVDIPFSETMRALEEEFQRTRASLSRGDPDGAKALLVVVTERHLQQRRAAELAGLAEAAGYDTVGTVFQSPRNEKSPSRFLVGKGKVTELFFEGLHRGADLIVFNRELTPSQALALQEATDLRIVDRTQIILEIFAKRARTKGGKIQVELATLRYSLPRLKGKGAAMSRLGGGIGTRGPGETRIEIERREINRKISALEKDIKALTRKRALNREMRKKREVPVISLIGYTNTGKSTLLNKLTESGVFAENMLFATLDPTSRRLRFPKEREVVITDTVGFIRDMPSELLRAFEATFEELKYADLLVNVLDASDPEIAEQDKVVREILGEIGLGGVPVLNVLNKVDLVDEERLESLMIAFNAPAVSALNEETLEPMLNRMEDLLWGKNDV